MPLLIYYRKDGAIVHHHLAPAAWGPEELKKKIEEYNAEHPERPAYSLEVEPGSLDRGDFRGLQAGAPAYLSVPHKEPPALLRPRQRREAPGGAELLVRNDGDRERGPGLC